MRRGSTLTDDFFEEIVRRVYLGLKRLVDHFALQVPVDLETLLIRASLDFAAVVLIAKSLPESLV